MSDLIDREEAMNAIKTSKVSFFLKSHSGLPKFLKEIKIIHQNILNAQEKAINDLPSAQQWIPCSERLPEKEKPVLICLDDGTITDGIFYGIGEIIEWDGAMDERCFDVDEVVAWMPLPEPYKEGE